jgi:hypothetical protein
MDLRDWPATVLMKDERNIRLVPHYWLGVFFILVHLAAGSASMAVSR